MESLNSILLKTDDEHKKLWWIYFVLTNNEVKKVIDIKPFYKSDSLFLKSFSKRKQKFFDDLKEPILFINPDEDLTNPIAKCLNIFKKE